MANYEKAQEQLDIWQQEHGTALEEKGTAETEQAEYDEYIKGQREKTLYHQKERYTEAPMYGETFAGWMGEQEQFSGALQQYVERQYPSLQSQYKAGMPRQTGSPTREEARTEAAKREAGFAAWLSGETPGIYQKYMAQRPTERGERLWMQAPNVKELGW